MKVQEVYQKQAHLHRAEAAQARKEEKRRAEKDKIMAEEDPEKQRRMEVGDDNSWIGVTLVILVLFYRNEARKRRRTRRSPR